MVTESAQLYVFGCGDGGRLGLGTGKYETHFEPILVNSLLQEKISSVSCGNTTTIVSTEVRHEWAGDSGARYRKIDGGKVYIAGSRNVLGLQYDTFTLLKEMENKPVKHVSAGYQHTAIVTADGELYCWGKNRNICCGSNPKIHFLPTPTLVQCLYEKPRNLALGQACRQSSTYSGRDAGVAVNGDIDGFGMKKCTCTQQDAQGWWEVDLGAYATIDEVRIWNRTDAPHDKSMPQNQFTCRLFPFWVMISTDPFQNFTGSMSLKTALKQSVAKVRFTEDMRLSTWRCPRNTLGRYVRVQIESVTFLHLAQVEVMGFIGYEKGIGQVSHATAGRDVTVAVIRAINDQKDIESQYIRAAYSDSTNADILRQLETYALEYDKFGRGEVLEKNCMICKGLDVCEICNMKQLYGHEIVTIPLGVGGRRRRLKSIEKYLVELLKPPLPEIIVAKKKRPTKWEMRRKRWNDRFTKWFQGKKKKNVDDEDEEEEDAEEIIQNFKMKRELLARTAANNATNPSPASAVIALEEETTFGFSKGDDTDAVAKGAKAIGSYPKSIQKKLDNTNDIRAQMKTEEEEKRLDNERRDKKAALLNPVK